MIGVYEEDLHGQCSIDTYRREILERDDSNYEKVSWEP